MPYEGELASKASHSDIVRNPEVAAFLGECMYLRPPGEEEASAMRAQFGEPPPFDQETLPERVMSVDGSWYEASMDDRLPSTKVAYVKIGSILILMREFQALRIDGGRFVDPFRVARLEDRNWPLTMPLPSANVRWRSASSVRDSFRGAVDAHLYAERTRFQAGDASSSLRATLFHLASARPGFQTGDATKLILHKCPVCEADSVEVSDTSDVQQCPHCGGEVFPSDVLRIWQEVGEFQSNAVAVTRFMLAIEHLLPVHFMRHLRSTSPRALSGLTFFLDGPLAVFGPPAWLHAALLKYIFETNEILHASDLQPVVVIGLQKTGQVVDHLSLVDRFLPPNRIMAVADEYRYRHILCGRDPAEKGFGENTYYGQDFLFKTPSGRAFVFALPYPCRTKGEIDDFANRKTDLGLYPGLSKALRLITHFESDLYTNAVVPIALAHRYTAISLVPGGHVLDLLTERAFEGA